MNSLTSLTTVLGAVIGYMYFSTVRQAGGYFLAIAAGGFLYVALADLIPSQRGRTSMQETVIDLALMTAGVVLIGSIAASHGH